MILCIGEVLSSDAVARIVEELRSVEFVDGKRTAGWHARTVKRNTQADSRDRRVTRLRTEVDQAIQSITPQPRARW